MEAQERRYSRASVRASRLALLSSSKVKSLPRTSSSSSLLIENLSCRESRVSVRYRHLFNKREEMHRCETREIEKFNKSNPTLRSVTVESNRAPRIRRNEISEMPLVFPIRVNESAEQSSREILWEPLTESLGTSNARRGERRSDLR